MPVAPLRRLALVTLLLAAPLGAQRWQSGRSLRLVSRATAARATRDHDTLLVGWRAMAHGMVRFAAEVEHGGTSIERVIRADELRVEVYGEAPNRSKQRIVAWRDTVFQPTPIIYHRDHLGIVANDFGARIRLGNGDEVRDVVQPLSDAGLDAYQFRLGDTVRIGSADRILDVVAVDVRPVDPAAPGVIGRMYLDVDRAALVRFRFTFTAASYRDPTVASITVELENALSERRWWLPRRQAIVIRRAEPLLALPITTVLRADWIIDDYRLGVRHPAGQFDGPAIAGLRHPVDTAWAVPLAIRLAELPATSDDIEALRAVAAELAPAARLDGLPAFRFLGSDGLSAFLHANRVEGVALGAGVRLRLGERDRVDLSGSVATTDGRMHGMASWRLGDARRALNLVAEDRIVDVADGAFGSRIANSLTTLIGNDDAGDWLRLRRLAIGLVGGGGSATRWTTSLAREEADAVVTGFRMHAGTSRPNPDLGAGAATVARFEVGRTTPGGEGWSLHTELGSGATATWLRGELTVAGTLAGFSWRLHAGGGSGELPAYRSFVAGGRGSLVGVPNRALGGRRLARVEVALPLAVAIPAPLGPRLARTVLASRITPYLAAAVAGGAIGGVPWRATGVVEPVFGVRLDLWGPLLRLDAGWAPRRGRVGLSVDAHPDWWPLL